MRRLMERFKRQEGFTLVEILIVVVIIGILAGIAVPMYSNVQEKAKVAATQAELSGIKTALVLWEMEHGAPPEELDEFISSLGSDMESGSKLYLGKYELAIHKESEVAKGIMATPGKEVKDRKSATVTSREITIDSGTSSK